MAGTVMLGKRSTGRRVNAIWLSTTAAMQTMRTRMGLRTAARVRNIGRSLSCRRRSHRAALAHQFGAAEHDGLVRTEAAGNLDHRRGRGTDRHAPPGNFPVRDDPHELLSAHGRQ